MILEIYASYPIALEAGLRAILVVLLIGLGVTLVSARLVGRDRGAAIAALILMGLASGSSAPAVAAAVGLILLERALANRGRLKMRVPWQRVTEALDLVFIAVVVLQVGRIAGDRVGAVQAVELGEWAAAAASRPDIYLILADGHGRRDVLRDGYGYPLDDLARSLAADGLVEAGSSTTNQSNTRLALPVLFNGRPLSELNPGADLTSDREQFPGPGSSSAVSLLRDAGYEVTFIAPGYEHIGLRGDVRFVDVGPRNEVEQAIINGTAVGRLLDQVTGGFLFSTYERTLREVAALQEAAHLSTSVPQFVYAHLPTPHWPVVFNADCSYRPADDYSLGAVTRDAHRGDATSITLVANQTRCVDSLVAEAVHEIVTARPAAVVIVLSDHGPEERIDWWEPAEPGIRDRMSNLFWARTPSRAGVFPEDISLVNVFPRLFNAYFETDLPLHPNDRYLGPSNVSPAVLPYAPSTP